MAAEASRPVLFGEIGREDLAYEVACRNRDTSPEKAVRSAVHALGLRFRVAARPLPELRRTADLVLRRASLAVHFDGCWWHGCPERSKPAKMNKAYWHPKIVGNRARDADTDQRLGEAGWVSLRVWEHENPTEVASRVAALVHTRLSDRDKRHKPNEVIQGVEIRQRMPFSSGFRLIKR